MPNRFLNNITINDEYTFPDADGNADQVIATNGQGELSFIDQTGGTSGVLSINVKNISGGTLTAGTAVSVATPSSNPPAGIVVEVIASDYDNINDMPAIGILNEDINNNAEGEAVMMGSVSSINTNSFNISDELYVGANGALVNSKPTTAGQLIQKIAVVVKKHSSNGVIKVLGAGRSNDVPLPLYIDNANQRVGISEPSPAEKLVVSETRSGTAAADQTKYTLVSRSTIASGTPGTGGIKVAYDDGTNEHGFGLVSGSSSADFLTTGPMHFYTNSDLNTNSATGYAMQLNNSGQLIIAGTNPITGSAKLSVAGETAISGNLGVGVTGSTGEKVDVSGANAVIRLRNSSSTAGTASGIVFGQAMSAEVASLTVDTSTDLKYIKGSRSSGTTQFIVKSSGNVGIGTSSPSSKLEIVDDLSGASTVEYPLTLSVKDDNNSIDQQGGEGVGIKFKIAGNDATDPGNSFVGAGIAAVREAGTDTYSHTGLAFYVSQNNETLDEVVKIDQDGYVGINQTNPNHPLHITKPLGGNDASSSQLKIEWNSAYNLAISHRGNFFGTANNDYTFYRGSDAQMIIKGFSNHSNYGYVGIGTDNPLANLHISSSTSGDATVIIEADTDNNDENDLPRLWFKADGGVTEGAIQLNNNAFEIISNVVSGGDIVFKTGATDNTGTTDPATGATERARITSAGVEINGVAKASYGNYLGYYFADPHDYINSASVFYWIKIGSVSGSNNDIKFQAEINTFGDNNYPRGSCYHVTVNKYPSSGGLSLSNYKISGSDYGDQLSLMVDSSFNIWIKRNISWANRILIRPMVVESGATFNSNYTGSNRVSAQPSGTPVLKHDGAFRVNYVSDISAITHDYRYKYFNIDGDNKMTILNSGAIGIDNSSPSFKLDIGNSLNDNDAFRVNGIYSNVLFSGNVDTPTGGVGLWNFINTGTNSATRFYVQDANNSSDRLTFRFTGNGGGQEILSGTSTGRIGIGNPTPARLLHLKADSAEAIITLQRGNANTGGSYGALQWTASDNHTVSAIDARADGNNEGAHLLFHTTSAASADNPYGINERMRISSTGDVGINIHANSYNQEAKFNVYGGSIGSTSGNSVTHAQFRGDRHRLDLKEIKTADGSDWNNTTFKMQMRVDSTNHQSIDFVSDGTFAEHIDIYAGNQVFNTRFKHDGNVGIGSTSAPAKLTVGDGATNVSARVYYNDNTYTEMRGYGVEFSRTASYLRPTADNNKTLNIGQSTLQWNTIRSNASTHTFETDTFEVVKILNYAGGNADAGNIIINSQAGTGWAPGDGLGKITFHTKDTSGLGQRDIAVIEAVSNDGNGSSTTTMSGALSFKTSAYNGTAKETFKLLPSGEVQLRTSSNANGGCKISFSDHEGGAFAQQGTFEYVHADSQAYGSGNAFKLYGTEPSMSFVVDGKTFSDQLILGTTNSQSHTLYITEDLTSSVSSAYFDSARANSGVYGAANVRVNNVEYGSGIKFYRQGNYGSSAIAFLNDSGTQVGSIIINGSSTTYNETSDYRLKENVVNLTGGIERIKQLQPKRFNFIEDPDNTVDGFIAHEAQEVVPESVTGEKDGELPNGDLIYQGIDKAKIVPLLTAALKEAIAKIENLETRIQTLENN